MAVLFLDIDGVLHPEQHGGATLTALPLLWHILHARPNTQVVISSPWRETRSLAELRALLTVGGGEDLAERIIDVTPVIPKDPKEHYRHREIECLAWLAANESRWPVAQRPVPWLALDDMMYWFSIPWWNLHLCDYRTGLTPEDVPKIIARLPE